MLGLIDEDGAWQRFSEDRFQHHLALARRLDPNNLDARLHYGWALVELGDASARRASATQVLRWRHPGSTASRRSFREKPDPETAREFVEAGHFGWNAGMFFWRADVFLAELREHLPETAALIESLPKFGARNFAAQLTAVFPKCENISVDYAILEKAQGVVGFAAGDIGWNDVGSWNAVHDLLPKDPDGNAAQTEALFVSASGNLVHAPGKLVALLGVDDLIVVETPDALLVARKDQAQRVGDVVKLLEKQKRDDLL